MHDAQVLRTDICTVHTIMIYNERAVSATTIQRNSPFTASPKTKVAGQKWYQDEW